MIVVACTRRPVAGRADELGRERPTYVNRRAAAPLRALVAALLVGAAAGAEAAADRILDQLSTDTGSVVVQFNCPMSYVSNYPLRSGDEVRIELQPLPGCAPPTGLGETLPVPKDNPAGLVDVRLDQSLGARRALVLHFARRVDFLIRPRSGLTGLEIVLSRRVGRTTVEPAEAPARASREPTRSLPPPEELEKLTAEARSAMQDRDYDAAIRLYTKLLEFPEHPGRPLAQEYLGLARERKGQLALAKLEYQEYLRRYPDGNDVEAVKQRLAAIVTLEGASKPGAGGPDGSRWQLSGAVAQEYRHDQNTLVSNGLTSDGIGQSALDTNVDLQLAHRGDVYDFRSRVYAGYLHDMDNVGAFGTSPVRLPQAYVELDNNQSRWVSRLGRQSQSTGGVYGTYDGGYFGWLLRPGMRIGFAAGSPLQTYAASNDHSRVFGNVALEFLGVVPGLDLSGYAFQQNVRGTLDAREVGMEARYYRNGRSLVGQLNYDVSFHVLNAVTVLGTWSLPDRWVLTGIGDHRRSPFASTYNALIGQPTDSLDSLIQSLGLDAVRQLALDRSLTSDTYSMGVQRPIGERLQWGADVSFSRTGAMPASGGVPAVASSGSAISFSTQLLGGGWLVDGDMNTVGLAYSTRAGTKMASTYGSTRFPIGEHFRFGPRLQLSHTSGSDPATGTSAGWSASPSLLADWRFRHGLVQFESGYERANFDASIPVGVPVDPNNPPATTLNQRTKRFWFSLGYNVSF
jgi:tetratricopeptide (TPR) repeat protein